jgi:hypothetical protein
MSQLRCGGGDVVVTLRKPSAASNSSTDVTPNRVGRLTLLVGLGVAAFLVALPLLLISLRRRRHAARIRREVDAVLANGLSPRELRRSVYEYVERNGLRHETLAHEESERGERFRAVMSLLDLRRTVRDEDTSEIDLELQERLAELIEEFRKETPH